MELNGIPKKEAQVGTGIWFLTKMTKTYIGKKKASFTVVTELIYISTSSVYGFPKN
jgi:hypothetical protein